MQYIVNPIPLTSSSAPTLTSQREYAVVAAQGGLVLQVAQSGAPATLQRWTEGEPQRWRIEPAGDGLFRIRSGSLVLGVKDASTAAGALVVGLPDSGALHQRWKLEASPNSWTRIRAAKSNLLLDAGSGAAGTPITQGVDDGAAGEVTAYKDSEYRNVSQSFGVGRWDLESMNRIGNDTISSLKVPRGLRVTIFQHNRFQGDSRTYNADVPYTSGFNDATSGLIVQAESQRSTTKVTIYSDGKYGGASQALGVGAYGSTRLAGFTRVISSLKVPSDKRVILYAEDGFTGLSRIYTADTPWVGDFNDLAASVIVEDVVSGVSQHWQLGLIRRVDALPVLARVTLYSEPQHENLNGIGPRQELGVGAWKKADITGPNTVGDNAVSELKVPEGLQVKLYDADNFGGASVTVVGTGGSTVPLTNLFDNRTTSLKVQPVIHLYAATQPDTPDAGAGEGWVLPPGRYDYGGFFTGALGGPGKVARIEVPAGMRVILYDRDGWSGNERVLVEGTTLDPAFRDKVRSALVQQLGVAVSPHAVKYGDRVQFATGSGRLASVALADGTRVNTFVIGAAGPTKFSSLVSYGDVVSLQAGVGTVTLYRDPNFGGPSQKLGVGRWLMADLTVGGDVVSSVRVPQGMKVTLYEGPNLDGVSAVLTGDAATLPASIDNKTSSLTVEQVSAGALMLSVANNVVTASTPGGVAPGVAQQFRVILSGGASQGSIVTHGDMLTLESVAATRLLTASANGALAASATVIGGNERLVVRDLRMFVDVAAGGDGSGPCGAEVCGQQACGAAVTGSGVCGADACGADACGVDACGVAACGADGSLLSACVVAVSGLSLCGADVCGAALCGADACGAAASGASACGLDACGAAACGADACGAAACGADACGVAAELTDACPANACGIDACAINACPVNACAVDACAIDLIPVIPGI